MGYAGGMNDVETINKVREVIARHAFPDFIMGYDIRLGDIDGDPAMWLVFQTLPGPGHQDIEVDRRISAMNALEGAMMPELLAAFDDRYPYIRYEPVRIPKAAAG